MTYKLGFLVFEYLMWSEVVLFIARMFYCTSKNKDIKKYKSKSFCDVFCAGCSNIPSMAQRWTSDHTQISLYLKALHNLANFIPYCWLKHVHVLQKSQNFLCFYPQNVHSIKENQLKLEKKSGKKWKIGLVLKEWIQWKQFLSSVSSCWLMLINV